MHSKPTPKGRPFIMCEDTVPSGLPFKGALRLIIVRPTKRTLSKYALWQEIVSTAGGAAAISYN